MSKKKSKKLEAKKKPRRVPGCCATGTDAIEHARFRSADGTRTVWFENRGGKIIRHEATVPTPEESEQMEILGIATGEDFRPPQKST